MKPVTLPFAPLTLYLPTYDEPGSPGTAFRSIEGLFEKIGWSWAAAKKAKTRNKIGINYADKMAVAMGMNPAQIWKDWYDLPTGLEGKPMDCWLASLMGGDNGQ